MSDSDKHARVCKFADGIAKDSVGIRAREQWPTLGLMSTKADSDVYAEVALYVNRSASERLLFRGDAVGFRTAYYDV